MERLSVKIIPKKWLPRDIKSGHKSTSNNNFLMKLSRLAANVLAAWRRRGAHCCSHEALPFIFPHKLSDELHPRLRETACYVLASTIRSLIKSQILLDFHPSIQYIVFCFKLIILIFKSFIKII
jgi:hypothetical protein